METITTTIYESLSNSLSYFSNPNKRVFIPYLITSALLAFYIYRKKKRKVNFLNYLFPKKIWLSKSARIDYGLLFFNGFVKVLLLAPILFLANSIAIFVNDELIQLIGFPEFSINKTLGILLFTLSLTLLSDFCTYLLHFLMHKSSFLWEFHKIHHNAESLNPLTQYRIHPVELILTNLKNILVIGFTTGLFFYIIGFQAEKLTILGVNIFSFIFLSFGANLRHSHVKLSYYPWLEKIIISPFQHQIHHSDNPEHFNKNMGSKLAIWDYLFGTLLRSKDVGEIQFGLGDVDETDQKLTKNIYMPFKLAAKKITNSLFKNKP